MAASRSLGATNHEGGGLKTEADSRTTPLFERTMALIPSESTLRTSYFTVEPTRMMRASGYEWDHEIRVALPVSYAETTKTYPVLWITDNTLEAALSVLGQLDLILVGVGADRIPVVESSNRRIYDFMPDEDLYARDPHGDHLRREMPALFPGYRGGGAARFLDFLIDDVRSALASEYRMDSLDHGLFGFSGGGTFVGFSIFARPGAFARYICGSPALYSCNHRVFDLEEQYAAEHDDLPAHVFLGAGEGELTEHLISAWGCASSMAKLAETLSFRGYPSLRLTVKVFAGETHPTMLAPLLSWGVRSVWGDEIFPELFRVDESDQSDGRPEPATNITEEAASDAHH